MKIIDLLNKIANGEEVPDKIKYEGDIYELDAYGAYVHETDENEYEDLFNQRCWNVDFDDFLTDEVEIIEEEPKPITKEEIEALGYACGEIQKCFINGWNKSLEEDKKIEKIDIKSDEATSNSYYILNEHGTKCYLTKHSKVIADKVDELIDKVNKLEKEE